jgi:serine/threonine protein kinase
LIREKQLHITGPFLIYHFATINPQLASMGVLQTIRARFPNTHVTPRNTVDSEETLMPSPDSSRSRRIKHYVKERGKSAGARVLKKLAKIIVDRNVDASNVSYGQPGAATQVQPSNPDDRYIDIRHLGSGGNGSVHLYRDRQMHILVAIKTIYHDANTPPNEALVLDYLGLHENVIQLYTTLTHPAEAWCRGLVFEYCLVGDLVDYTSTLEGPCSDIFLWHLFRHISSGLAFLPKRGVVHGDIKPANILLTTPRSGSIYPLPKIADFGSAAIHPSHDIPMCHGGTRGFHPPEAASRHGPEADIWALGCTIHEMAMGRLPLQRLEPPPDLSVDSWWDSSGMSVPKGTQDS